MILIYIDLHSTLFKLLLNSERLLVALPLNLHSTLFKLLQDKEFARACAYEFTFYFI